MPRAVLDTLLALAYDAAPHVPDGLYLNVCDSIMRLDQLQSLLRASAPRTRAERLEHALRMGDEEDLRYFVVAHVLRMHALLLRSGLRDARAVAREIRRVFPRRRSECREAP